MTDQQKMLDEIAEVMEKYSGSLVLNISEWCELKVNVRGEEFCIKDIDCGKFYVKPTTLRSLQKDMK